MHFDVLKPSSVFLTAVLLLAVGASDSLRAQTPSPVSPAANAGTTASKSAAQTSVAGRWRSVEVSEGGMGAFLDLRPDGTLDFTPGAIVPMTYRTDGNKLILPSGTKDGPDQVERFEFAGNDKLKISTPDSTVELTRQGSAPDAAHPMLGEWTAPRDLGGQHVTVHYIFSGEGKLLLLIPFVATPGKYSVTGASLHFELPDQAPADGLLSQDGGKITITGANGHQSHFIRY